MGTNIIQEVVKGRLCYDLLDVVNHSDPYTIRSHFFIANLAANVGTVSITKDLGREELSN